MKFLIVFSCLLAVACASSYGHHGLGYNYGHGYGLVAHAPIVSHTVAAAPIVKTIIPATYTSHVVSAPVLSHGYGYGHGGYLNHGLYGNSLLGHGLYGHGLALGHGGLLIKK